MADDQEPDPPSGWWLIGLGVLIGAFGGLVLGTDDGPPEVVGVVFLCAASLFSTIGAIAVGVTMGFERADHRRAR